MSQARSPARLTRIEHRDGRLPGVPPERVGQHKRSYLVVGYISDEQAYERIQFWGEGREGGVRKFVREQGREREGTKPYFGRRFSNVKLCCRCAEVLQHGAVLSTGLWVGKRRGE